MLDPFATSSATICCAASDGCPSRRVPFRQAPGEPCSAEGGDSSTVKRRSNASDAGGRRVRTGEESVRSRHSACPGPEYVRQKDGRYGAFRYGGVRWPVPVRDADIPSHGMTGGHKDRHLVRHVGGSGDGQARRPRAEPEERLELTRVGRRCRNCGSCWPRLRLALATERRQDQPPVRREPARLRRYGHTERGHSSRIPDALRERRGQGGCEPATVRDRPQQHSSRVPNEVFLVGPHHEPPVPSAALCPLGCPRFATLLAWSIQIIAGERLPFRCQIVSSPGDSARS